MEMIFCLQSDGTSDLSTEFLQGGKIKAKVAYKPKDSNDQGKAVVTKYKNSFSNDEFWRLRN